MDQFQVLMMQAVVLTMQKMAGSTAEAGTALEALLWGNPDVLLLSCIASWDMGCFLPLAYLSEIHNLYVFLDTLNKFKTKETMCFPGLSIGIAFWVQVIISFCDTSVFSLS